MRRFGAAFILLWVGFTAISAFGNPLQTIALSAEAAPEADAGATFRSFGSPSINAHGDVAFHANTLIGPTGSAGVWLGDASQLNLVVELGDSLPGTIGGAEVTFISNSFSPLPLNDAGRVLIEAQVRNPQ